MQLSEILSLAAGLAVFAAMFAGFFFAERERWQLAIVECDVAELDGSVF